ncbi:hypothetical protein [Flavobacterium selenitireducens]|uniref:hypothetical protein n=1 Tax=Flavobacterium selenitireducens TaxID=2722704 RepID=UPI00168A449C|nr:hypothetical protein [Flavobacterium selenitireducens]MBD3582718.1 hypothetical protein [Flavobacterium selenitireducens]
MEPIMPILDIFGLTGTMPAEHVPDDEFNLFLFSLLVIGIIAIGVCVAIGIVLTVLGLLVIFGLISMGALSASLLVGIHQKSVTKGFKAFAVIFTTSASGFAGAIVLWTLNRLMKWWTDAIAAGTGLLIGLVSGFLTGVAIAFAIQKIVPILKNSLDKRKRHPR